MSERGLVRVGLGLGARARARARAWSIPKQTKKTSPQGKRARARARAWSIPKQTKKHHHKASGLGLELGLGLPQSKRKKTSLQGLAGIHFSSLKFKTDLANAITAQELEKSACIFSLLLLKR